jgi:hypothetical protein
MCSQQTKREEEMENSTEKAKRTLGSFKHEPGKLSIFFPGLMEVRKG